MTPVRTEAIVLRRTNYGEADRILQLLTPDHGKVSVMARGVRKERSKLAGGIELFATTEVTYHKGKGSLDVLTGARLHTFFAHILDDYEKMQLGYEILKLAGAAVETVPEPEWFGLTKVALESLNSGTISLAITDTWFRLQYAALLGQGLNLLSDTEGNRLQADKTYRYDVGEMGLCLDERGELTVGHIKMLRLATSQPPAIIAQVSGIHAVLPACLQVARYHARVG